MTAIDAQDGPEDDLSSSSSSEPVFPFTANELSLISELSFRVRGLLRHFSPVALQGAAQFLYALQRLPSSTPGISIEIVNNDRFERSLSYVSATISSEAFSLSIGGSSYSQEFGSDSYSDTKLEVSIGGFREGSDWGMQEWLNAFSEARGTWTVEGNVDEEFQMEQKND